VTLAPYVPITASLEARRDPLARFHWKNWAARMLAENLKFSAIWWASSNKGGKTTSGAHLAAAMLRGEDELDGIQLPKFKMPCTGIMAIQGYKQSSDSTVRALREAIGDWPHHEVTVAGHSDWIETFYVKPNGATTDDVSKLSKLTVYPHGGVMPTGARTDFVWCDEPPPIKFWSEMVQRDRANAPFVAFITATPKNRFDTAEGAGWDALDKWFPAERNRVIYDDGQDFGRMRIVSTIHDNLALSAADVRRAVSMARGDLYEKARLYGELQDTTGSNPFHEDVLQRWEEMCVEPHVERLVVQAEKRMRTGLATVQLACDFEMYAPHDPNEFYYVLFDVGQGISDGKHDPDGLHVYAARRRMLVGRINGYMGGWGIAMAAAQVADAYPTGGRPSLIFPLRGGGQSEAALSALRVAGYAIGHDYDAGKMQDGESYLGVSETSKTRGMAMEAVSTALVTGDVTIRSRAVIECFKRCIVDASGKIVAGPGSHDEDLVLAGHALRLMRNTAGMIPPVPVERESTSAAEFKRAFRESFGTVPSAWRNGNGSGVPMDSGKW
jgi:hypothetical protein